jgi:single-strand DNA-binding protein
MGSLNRVTIIGRLGKDPELRYTPSSKAVCNFSVATSEKFKDKETTEWHSVVCWDKTAENAAKFLAKGREVAVEGRLQTRSWDKDGVKHFKTEIVADRVVFLGGGERSEGGGGSSSKVAAPEQPPGSPLGDDDIPFVTLD